MSVQIKGVGTIGGIDQGLNTVGVITATSLVGTGVSVVGVITATTFSGSGASLTNLPAANVTGQFSATAITIDYDNLPTSDPNVKGRLWVQNYGTGKTLMISDG